MDLNPSNKTYATSTISPFSTQWQDLPTLPDVSFDSPWRNNTIPPFPSVPTYSPLAIHPEQLHKKTHWQPSAISGLSCASSNSSSNSSSDSGSRSSSSSASLSLNYNLPATPYPTGARTTEYRPRAPIGKRKGATRRITPKSKKHAHELSRNRTAATKYRNRQKTYVDDLQQKCKEVEMKRDLKLGMVQALRDEVLGLKRELMRHAHCAG